MNSSLTKAIDETYLIIRAAKNIFLTTHEKADGDAVGSITAMYHFLKNINKNVIAVFPDNIPEEFLFLVSPIKHHIYTKTPDVVKNYIYVSDLFVGVDMHSIDRCGPLAKELHNVDVMKVFFDHHPLENDKVVKGVIIEKAPSAAEVIATFMEKIFPNILFSNTQIMEAIAAGIITDTGRFFVSKQIHKSFEYITKFVSNGMDYYSLAQRIYNTLTENKIRLMGYLLHQKLDVIKELHTAVLPISQKDITQFNVKDPNTDALHTIILRMKDIFLSIVIYEFNEYVKISFRSKGPIDVNKIAKTHFGGGGHKNASSAKVNKNFHEVVREFYNILKIYAPLLKNLKVEDICQSN